MKNWQLWLATYGAIVATLGLGWQIWTRMQDQPQLAVISAGPPTMPRPTSNDPGGYLSITAPIAIMNIGRKPLTIVAADFRITVRAEFENDRAVIPEYEAGGVLIPKLDSANFPMRLDAGDARTVNSLLRFEVSPTQAFQKGFTVDMIWNFKTTLGDVARQASVVIDAYTLNRRLPH